MEYLIGSVLALATVVFARLSGFDRDRVFYPTLLIVVATYDVVFAVQGGDAGTIIGESLIAAAFAVVAVIGFRTSLWIIAAGLFAHGVLDELHQFVIATDAIPGWWVGFCSSFDVVAAGALAWLLLKRDGRGLTA